MFINVYISVRKLIELMLQKIMYVIHKSLDFKMPEFKTSTF